MALYSIREESGPYAPGTLSVRQVANALQRTDRLVRKHLARGRIKGAKIGGLGAWRIWPDDLQAYLYHGYLRKAEPDGTAALMAYGRSHPPSGVGIE